jgi:iron(III) transport system permease protein
MGAGDVALGSGGGRAAHSRYANVWAAGAVLLSALVMVPLLTVAWLAVSAGGDIWPHLAATVLPHYLRTTASLMLGVGLGTLIIGVGTAWLVTMCRFPGQQFFEWGLLLPLAVPAYVVAYVYTDILEFAGPVQVGLRGLFGWVNRRDYWFPDIRSVGGATVVMTLVLYPYVYLLVRAAFLEQSVCVLEASRTLGRGPWGSFFRVALPLARPAIVVGVSLVLMETLNDFGTVDYFGVATLTAGIYDAWLNMGSLAGAAQIALVMLAFVVVLIAAERLARRGRRFHQTSTRYRPLPRYRLVGVAGVLAVVACALPVLLGFGVPALVLVRYALLTPPGSRGGDFLGFVWNSLMLSSIAAVVAVAIGLFLAYGGRLHRTALLHAVTRVAGIGYAIPGAVLAVGVILPVAAVDNAANVLAERMFGVSTGLLLGGSIAALIFGYTVRFLALSLGAAEAGLAKITPSMDGAARTLGLGPGGTFRSVHLPIMKSSIVTAAILVFVDGMKELPMTVLLRPFNFETLATHVHQFASHELLAQGALGAVCIVAAGMLPVIALSRTIRHARPGQGDGDDRWG